MKETSEKISLRQCFQGRHVLLTGSTGFLGKVLLAMMLDRLPQIECIYLLIRESETITSLERFIQEVLQSPVFQPLQKQKKQLFTQFIVQHVKIIQGDITLKNLGIEDSIADALFEKIDLVINVAGLVDFSPDIRRALASNVMGALNVADFVKQCHNAALVHVSTCYVAGKRSGVFQETLQPHKAPNNEFFDPEIELKTLLEKIDSAASTKRNYIEIGEERANRWGWNNTYVYTKALAECLLVKRYSTLRMAMVRPSIIESAFEFPFPGWNEGLTTTAPLCYVIGKWYPFFLGKKDIVIDLVPVDLVSNAMLTIGASLLLASPGRIYHLSTSDCNPLSVGFAVNIGRSWHQAYAKKHGNIKTRLQTLLPLKFISIDSPFAPRNLLKKISKFNSMLPSFIKNKINALIRDLRRIDKVYTTFYSFTNEYSYTFSSENIKTLLPEEKEFLFDPKRINWVHYCYDVQMPGINQWVFSFQDGKLKQNITSILNFTRTEKTALVSLLPQIEDVLSCS